MKHLEDVELDANEAFESNNLRFEVGMMRAFCRFDDLRYDGIFFVFSRIRVLRFFSRSRNCCCNSSEGTVERQKLNDKIGELG